MDFDKNATTQNKKSSQQWVNSGSFYDTFLIQRLCGWDTPSCSGPWNKKQRWMITQFFANQCFFIVEYVYTAFQVKLYSIAEICFWFCGIVKVLQTNQHICRFPFFLLFSFYYDSNSLFSSFISNYFTHFSSNYKKKKKRNTSGRPHYSCTLEYKRI